MNLQKKAQSSAIARKSAARLAAVQAVYQILSSGQSVDDVVSEFKLHRLGKDPDGNEMVLPDGILFTEVTRGVVERMADLQHVIDTNLQGQDDTKANAGLNSIEPLLRSILLCGSFELLAYHDIDPPIIISDYLEVTHAFYESGEAKLVNGVLDRLKDVLRDS